MFKTKFKMKARVWVYSGSAAWHFLTLPQKESSQIKRQFNEVSRGWGSLPVKATINKTSWNTSIFPDKKSNLYLLPLKADVRKKEDIKVKDNVEFLIEIIP